MHTFSFVRFLAWMITTLIPVAGYSFDVCFITLHPASAHHFAKFTEVLDENKISWQILAGDSAETILKQKKISHRRLNVWTGKKGVKNLSHQDQKSIAKLIAKECKKDKIVITDISEPFMARVHHELMLVSSAKRYVYYDNPEPYVPGEYSEVFTTLVSTRPEGVLFASAQLPHQEIFGEHCRSLELHRLEKIGLGFYPMEQVETLTKLVEDKKNVRHRLFEQLGIIDQKQKVLLYLGGANTPYFEEGFPFFLQALGQSVSDPFFDNILFLLQQHPRAKDESLDLYALLSKAFPFQVFTSPLPPLEAVACSDLTYYYQTSMIPYLVLAGCPVVQVSPSALDDIGVKSSLVPSIREAQGLSLASNKALSETHSEASLKAFQDKIGYQPDWPQHFVKFLKERL